MHNVPPGPPDQLARLERYRREHPDVAVEPPGAQSAVWRGFRDGELIAYGFTLMVFMDRLEALPGPLGTVQDFGLQHLARRPRPRGPVKYSRFTCATAGAGTARRDLGATAPARAGDTQMRRPAGEHGIQWPSPGKRLSDTSAVLALLRRTEQNEAVGRQAAVVLYVLALAAVVVGVDVLFFRHHLWARLIVNIAIVLVFAAFYLRFVKRP